MGNDIVVGATVKSTLTSIQRARENLDRTSLRLATGKEVNSPIDQPQNFFQSTALTQRANDFNKLFDSMSIGVRTIQQALTGLETIENILNLAEVKALEAKETLEKTDSALTNLILDDGPVAYFRLNDSDQAAAGNLGTNGASLDGNYLNGVGQSDEILFYGAGGLAATFDGTGQYVDVPSDIAINETGPFSERSVELIFNADSVTGRQVLWEEGGTVNSMNIYIDDGELRVNGRTTSGGGYGPLDISIPIEAGVSYHVAFVQSASSDSFTGYLNGVSFGSESLNGTFIGNHPNDNGIGGVNQNVYFHDDGPGNAPGRANGTFSFDGQISDVAIYNKPISAEGMRARYEATSLPLSQQFREETQDFLEQVQSVIEDSNFRGINLLDKEDLIVDFSRDRREKSQLEVDGQDFGIEALELDDINYQKPSQVEAAIRNIRNAISEVRDYGTKLVTDLSIVETRQDFTRNTIFNLENGAADLVNADLNKEGANLLSAQTRLDLSTTALSLAGQSQASILDIFTGSSGFSV